MAASHEIPVNNITESKHTEEALHESEEKYRTLFNTLTQGVVYQNADGRIISANPAAERILGLTLSQMQGRTSMDPRWKAIREDGSDFPGEEHPIPVALKTGKPVNDVVHGIFHPEKNDYVWLKVNAVPLFRPDETSPYQAYATIEDITGQRKAENNYRMLFGKMLNGFALHEIVLDDEGTPVDYRFLDVNPAFERMTGLKADDIIGKTVLTVLPGTEHHWIKTYGEVALTGVPVFFENHAADLDKYFEVTAFRPSPGQFACLLADITKRKKALMTLQETQSILQAAMDNSEAGIAIADAPNGALRYVNNAGLLIRGGTRESVVNGIGIDRYVASWKLFDLDGRPLDPDEVPLARAIKFGETCGREFIIRRDADDDRTVLAKAAPIKDPAGNVIAGIVVFMDITDRKKTEEDLYFAYLKLDAFWNVATVENANIKIICDHVLESITRMTESKFGFYGFINDDESVMTIHSWSGEAMKGCSMVDKPSRFPIADAGIWGEAVRRRKPLIVNDYSMHHPAKKGLPEGHVPLTRLMVIPVFSGGKIVSVAAVANRTADYTEADAKHLSAFTEAIQAIIDRKYTAEQLLESNTRLGQALSAANAGTWDWNMVDNTFYWSKEFLKIFGMNTGVTPGFEAWSAAVHPDDRHMAEKRIRDSITEKSELVNDYRIIHPDGSHRWIRSIGKTLFEGEKPVRMSGLCMDITERKQAEIEREKLEHALNQAQKLESLGLLAGGIAHDFNNLMGGIFGYIDLASGESRDKKVTGYLSKALNTIDRARALTLQLLTFAKGGDPVKGTGRLFPFVQETAQFALSGANVSCTFDVPVDLWTCTFDKHQIGQVVDNLIINAQQAMPLGGNIELSARNITFADKEHLLLAKGNYVRLSIKDCGIGIPKELLSRIFDPFFTTKAKGHGLGLASCYSIITRHGGCIDVESEPGKGSTFRVYLPASTETVPPEIASTAHTHKGSGAILVMDDEEVMRETIGDMLLSLGYTVESANNGEDAVESFAKSIEHHKTLSGVILDLTVPGAMGGRAAAEEIRKLDAEIPVFVASGYSEDPVMKNPAHYGFTASISKPFRKTELSKMLKKHIQSADKNPRQTDT